MDAKKFKTKDELVEEFHRHAEGCRMAAGVSTIKVNSVRFSNLMAQAQAWDDAALLLRQTVIKEKTA